MGDSAFEAIYTGVYIFIFIAAFTITLYLFQGINEVANNAYEYGKMATDKSLLVNEVDTDYSSDTYNVSNAISSYYNYVERDKFQKEKDENGNGMVVPFTVGDKKYEFKFDNVSSTNSYKSLLESYRSKDWTLKLDSSSGNKYVWKLN